MTEQVFAALDVHYPTIIAQMSDPFTSHKFILELARQYQDLYVEALYAYRDSRRGNKASPFQVVHGILAQRLGNYPELIEKIGNQEPSIDIFGQKETCSLWRKL